MKNRISIKTSYFFIFLIVIIYLCTVFSSYHAISFLSLILILFLLRVLYKTSYTTLRNPFVNLRKQIILKLNRDIVICNKVLSLSNIGILYNFSRWLYGLTQSFIQKNQPLFNGGLRYNMFLVVLAYLLSILRILVHFIKVPENTPSFDWSADLLFSRPVAKKQYNTNIRNIYSRKTDYLDSRSLVVNSVLFKNSVVHQSDIELAKASTSVSSKKAYILTELRNAYQRLDSYWIDYYLMELEILESNSDSSLVEDKYFPNWDTLLGDKNGLHKYLSMLNSDSSLVEAKWDTSLRDKKLLEECLSMMNLDIKKTRSFKKKKISLKKTIPSQKKTISLQKNNSL